MKLSHISRKYKDIVGIGNAMVDILSYADEAFLSSHGMAKDGMTLVSSEKITSLRKAIGSHTNMPGGSVANTMAGIAALGGTGTYIGKVHNDQMGKVFHNKLESLGIKMANTPTEKGLPTAQCIVIITPNEHRSMAVYLGATTELGPEDISTEVVNNHHITYLEGYLLDSPRGEETILKAIEYSKSAGHKVALTLSDSMCVERHRASFLTLIRKYADILFGNEQEITSLYEVKTFSKALENAAADCKFVALTRGADGSTIVSNGDRLVVKPVKIDRVVDVTGAGDLYASGILFGITHGYKLKDIGAIGSIVASEAISHIGARPEADLQALINSLNIIN